MSGPTDWSVTSKNQMIVNGYRDNTSIIVVSSWKNFQIGFWRINRGLRKEGTVLLRGIILRRILRWCRRDWLVQLEWVGSLESEVGSPEPFTPQSWCWRKRAQRANSDILNNQTSLWAGLCHELIPYLLVGCSFSFNEQLSLSTRIKSYWHIEIFLFIVTQGYVFSFWTSGCHLV